MLRCALAAVLLLPAAAAAGIQIQMTGGAFHVTGWNAAAEPAEGWASIFAVYAGGIDSPAILGSYSVEGGVWSFALNGRLRPDCTCAPFSIPLAWRRSKRGSMYPKPRQGAATRIEHIYPSTDTLPANTLKLYIYFSAPMRRGEAWQHIQAA